MNTILQGKKVSRIFLHGNKKTAVLDQIDLEIYDGYFTVIMDP